MHVMQIITHSPESCPLGNPQNLATKLNWLEKIESLASRYGIKVLGVWTDRWGHTSWVVYQTPNMETFAKLEVEPEFIAMVTFTTIETKMVTVKNETLTFLKTYKA
jgi:hypothetical protein